MKGLTKKGLLNFSPKEMYVRTFFFFFLQFILLEDDLNFNCSFIKQNKKYKL